MKYLAKLSAKASKNLRAKRQSPGVVKMLGAFLSPAGRNKIEEKTKTKNPPPKETQAAGIIKTNLLKHIQTKHMQISYPLYS